MRAMLTQAPRSLQRGLCYLLGVVAVLGGLSGCGGMLPGLSTGGVGNASRAAGGGSYTVSWCVTTHGGKSGGRDWQNQIDLDQTPVSRDTVIFYESELGEYPKRGPQIVDDDRQMASHLAKVARDVAARIPDVGWSGNAVIDYEAWVPLWESRYTGPDVKQAWAAHMQAKRPGELRSGDRERVLSETYNRASRAFFLRTLAEAKRVRPGARWGYYGFPTSEYYTNDPKLRPLWKQNNEDLAWLFEASDALYPHAYTLFVPVRSRQPVASAREQTHDDNARYITDNTLEAVRVARGKPVLVFIWPRFSDSAGPSKKWKLVDDETLSQMINLPREAGASGVVLWDSIESPEMLREWRETILPKMAPALRSVGTPSPLPAAPTDPRLRAGARRGGMGGAVVAGDAARSTARTLRSLAVPSASMAMARPASTRVDRRAR
jgi:hypothetical protein